MTLATQIKNRIKIRGLAERYTHDLPSLMMAAEKTAAHIMHGPHAQRKAGSGEKFWQFREYQSSDRPQDIDWRHSAKGDTTYTRQKELQKAAQTYIWCESGRAMNFKSSSKLTYSKQEAAHIISLALALLLKRGEEQFGLFGDPKTGNSEERLQKLALGLLGDQNKNSALPDLNSFNMPRHASLIAVGSFLTPIEAITENFELLRAKTSKALIVQILDPAEINLDYNGRVLFEGVDSSQFTIDHVPSVKAAYQGKIQSHMRSIQKLCAELGWTYQLCITDSDLSETLREIIFMLNNEGDA